MIWYDMISRIVSILSIRDFAYPRLFLWYESNQSLILWGSEPELVGYSPFLIALGFCTGVWQSCLLVALLAVVERKCECMNQTSPKPSAYSFFRPATDDCHIWSLAYPWGWPCDCHLFIDGTIPVQDQDPASVGRITQYRKGLSHFLFTLEVRSNRCQIIREALQNLENLRDYSLEIQETVLKCFESAVRSTFGESPFSSDVIVETNGHSAAVCDDGSSTAGSSINEKNRFRTRKPHTTM